MAGAGLTRVPALLPTEGTNPSPQGVAISADGRYGYVTLKAAAKVAVERWRELDRYSGEAALTAALVAFKRYDLAEARKSLANWRDSGIGGAQDPLTFAELLQQQIAKFRVA